MDLARQTRKRRSACIVTDGQTGMTQHGPTGGGDDEKTRHDLNRTVQHYALLMGIIGCVNLWLYWADGMRLSLWLGIGCFVCLVAWVLFARRTMH